MSEENQEHEKKGFRFVLSKLACLPTQYLTLVGRIITMLIGKGDTFAPLLEKVLMEIMPKQVSLQPSIDIEGEYEIPALDGGKADLSELFGVAMSDVDYRPWGLHECDSESSEKMSVVIAQSEDNMLLSRLLHPTNSLELCLTQAQIGYLIRLLNDRLIKITKAGVYFFFRVLKEDGVSYDLYSFKVVAFTSGSHQQLRFAVRRADNPKNVGVPLKGAYIVRPQKDQEGGNL